MRIHILYLYYIPINVYIYLPYILYVALFILYITILCLFKAQYVQYEGNNLKQKIHPLLDCSSDHKDMSS